MSNLNLAISICRSRELIKPRGSSSISRMSAVLSDGAAIFVGHNSYRSHPMMAMFNTGNPARICLHAEVHALVQARDWFAKRTGLSKASIIAKSRGRWGGFELSVARVLADGSTGLAKPCEVCQRAIEYFGIEDVEFTI